MRDGDGGALTGLVTCVNGASSVVSGRGGDVRPGGAQGVFVRDTRFLDQLEVLIDGARTAPLSSHLTGGASAVFHSHSPHAVTEGGEPRLVVERHRVVDGSVHERITVTNHADDAREIDVAIVIGTDLAHISDVKHGVRRPRVDVEAVDGGVRLRDPDHLERPEEVVVTCDPPGRVVGDRIVVPVRPRARGAATITVDVTVTDAHATTGPGQRTDAFAATVLGPAGAWPSGSPLEVRSTDHRLDRLVRRSLVDLRALEMRDPLDPDDRFHAAGSPWYLTLFGRDALWAALMALPTGTDVARGTLRALARRQGRRHDPETEEAPGKILHEIRRGGPTYRGALPPVYYGTVDATPLFVVLLSEAWRWGLDPDVVRSLLPNLRAALDWITGDGDPDGDGLLEYHRPGELGLTNQGWKDSEDGIRFADGRIAVSPITLVEVQGYAYDAASRAAELLDRAGEAGAQAWRDHADAIARSVRDRFWVSDDAGRYPAIALDRDGVAVDAPASNMGHLLATGILDDAEAAAVATRLTDPTLDSGWGLRTMATTTGGYNPFSYHAGSVWPHDTAITVWGLGRSGHHAAAQQLLDGLIRAAPAFDHRLPELFSGLARRPSAVPVPYPAACQPQAWSAGAALLVLRTILGIEPHVPDGRITIRPLWPPPVRELEARGLRIGAGSLDVRVHAEHGVDLEPRDLDAEIELVLP